MVSMCAPAAERRWSNSGVVRSGPFTTFPRAQRLSVSPAKKTEVQQPRLLVIVPSRGRPGKLADLITAIRATRTVSTQVAVGLDGDDLRLREYLTGPTGSDIEYVVGDRKSLTGWTNAIALDRLSQGYSHYASLGDDHLPRTEGWDDTLMRAAGRAGIAYGNDLAQGGNLATAPVISVGIVRVLGWMCHPKMAHYCVDNVWTDLGHAADCLTYCPDVIIEHLHPAFGKGEIDATYQEAGGFHPGHPDYQAYLNWVTCERSLDAAKVQEAW